ncbi:hypothetical protein BKD26_34170 [Streptomyces sp. CB03238]|nr:hypothetical protein BKD26_34170 [Streptomyces sp. CB03238]
MGVPAVPVAVRVDASDGAGQALRFLRADARDGAGQAPVAVRADAGHGAEEAPGCGAPDDEGRSAPAVPPRSGSLSELLPALHAARVATGAWGADETVLDVRPERGPPPLVPPSPMDLSILRV